LQEVVSSKKTSVSKIITNLDTITTTFSNSTEEFDKTLENLSALSDTLANLSVSPMLQNILDATDKINVLLAQLESTDNTAGLF
jgi:phospholipid/cholesterol/gamma-HCH transport system substrate-binding protein